MSPSPEPVDVPTVTVKGKAADFLAYVNGDEAGTRAVVRGTLTIQGNDAIARKTVAIFPHASPATTTPAATAPAATPPRAIRR